MAVSKRSAPGTNGLSVEVYGDRFSRYDVLLAAIPLVLAAALLIGALFPVPFYPSVGGGAALGGLFVADALYFNPPTEPPADER